MIHTAEKDAPAPDFWQLIYHETMDALIAVTERGMAKHTRQFITDLNDENATSWMESARHESWQLLKNGLQHLKEWSPGRGPGSTATALKKASLRSSAIAVSLGVPAPEFQEPEVESKPKGPKEEALFLAGQLVTLSQRDLKASHDAVKKAITEDKVMAVFGINNPELKKLFQSVSGQRGMTPPPEFVAPADIKKMERQMKAQLGMLTAAYNESALKMQKAIFWLPLTPTKFGEKIQAPDI